MHGNSGDAVGVSQHVTRAHVYEPAFGRLFRTLSLTPSGVAGVAISTAFFAYLASRFEVLANSGLFSVVLMWAGIPALAFVFNQGRAAYGAAGATLLLTAAAFSDTPARSLTLFVGLGGAAVAIVAAHHRVRGDRAFDNFDQFLSVTAVALCWSIVGACLATVDPGTARGLLEAPLEVLGPIALGLSISIVAMVGDVRRLIWLRRLSSGRLGGYAVSTEAEGEECAELPALMGGAASDARLVIRESLPGLPFRSGWRETPVARVPRDPKRLVYRAGARLFVVGVAAGVQLLLSVSALSSP